MMMLTADVPACQVLRCQENVYQLS